MIVTLLKDFVDSETFLSRIFLKNSEQGIEIEAEVEAKRTIIFPLY